MKKMGNNHLQILFDPVLLTSRHSQYAINIILQFVSYSTNNVFVKLNKRLSWTYPVFVLSYLLHLKPLGTFTLSHLASHLHDNKQHVSECLLYGYPTIRIFITSYLPRPRSYQRQLWVCRRPCWGAGLQQTHSNRCNRLRLCQRCLPLLSSPAYWWETLQQQGVIHH